ncbi:MAG TPA: PKD domain-containing protein, partial [Bacteroidia bacterium]
TFFSIIPGDSVSDSLYINPSGLTIGFHSVYFRVKDTNNVWSLYEGTKFFIYDTTKAKAAAFDSSSAEHFFDADPGVGQAIVSKLSPGDSVNGTIPIPTAGLSPGFHYFFIRAKDSNRVWSLYEGSKFYLTDTLANTAPASHPIAAAEYFYDTDPGKGNGVPVSGFSPADSVLLTNTLATAPLTSGTHHLYVRVRDTMNVWSLYDWKSFLVCNLIPKTDFKADSVCLNNPTTFTDLTTNLDTVGHFTYSWDFNNDGITDDTTKGSTHYTFQSSGSHTVVLVVNNASGCIDTMRKTVYVDSLPVVSLHLAVDTICLHDSLVLSGGSPAGGFFSGVGVHNTIFYSDTAHVGNHYIAYTYVNSYSCSATASALIYVSPCTGINEVSENIISTSANPNPFFTSTTIQITNMNRLSGCELKLYSVLGSEIKANVFRNNSGFTVNRGSLTGGVYFYKVFSSGKMVGSGKLVLAD